MTDHPDTPELPLAERLADRLRATEYAKRAGWAVPEGGQPDTDEVPPIESLAAKVHQAYLDTCDRLGWSVKPENQVPYAELSEDSKELDRASVRAVLAAAFKRVGWYHETSGFLVKEYPAGLAQSAEYRDVPIEPVLVVRATADQEGTDG